jgi:glycosyltransferase involved in cell wall biosynthesis
MRIALAAPAPFDTVSGGYNYDRAMIAGLRALGHEVLVIEQAGRHPLPDSLAEANARDTLLGLPEGWTLVIDGLGLPAFSGLADTAELGRAVGLIHHPTPLEKGLAEADAAMLRSREAAVLPRLARLVATSAPTAEALIAMGLPESRIAVVEPGTARAPRAPGTRGAGCHLLSLGALVPRKGHDVLLRALGRLPDLDWKLTIVGHGGRDPAHAASLKALAETLGIAQRVTFPGEVPAEALEELWQATDIFALATWYEGYGMAAAEALARGIPLAITAGGAIAALAQPAYAVVSKPGEHALLSKGLRRMIYDGEQRARMKDAAWEAGSKLPDWPAQAEKFVAALAA